MSTVIYEWSRAKTAVSILLMVGCVVMALIIVEFGLISPESLSYFSDAFDLTTLVLLLAVTLGVSLGYVKRRK